MSQVHDPAHRPAPPIVFASVGTDVHPFDRLVRWVDSWAAAHPEIETVVQYGSSEPPHVSHGVDFLDHEALLGWVGRAAVVITHGGPATIMEVRAHHGPPVVIPRDPARGEHVDRHQMDFCEMLARRGDIDLAQSREHLEALVDQRMEAPVREVPPADALPSGVRRFAELVDELLAGRYVRDVP